MRTQQIYLFFIGIFLLSAVMHRSIFTEDLSGKHLWRQSQTQLNVLNFARHDMNILNPRHNNFNNANSNIQRMEFPIMQWSIAAIYRLIGESIIITRICMFFIGILASLGMFIIIQELFKNQLVSFITTFVFTFSPLFYYYTMNPLPDMFALAFGLLSTGFFLRYLKNETVKSHLFLSGLFFSLSVLAKLPFIIFGIFPIVIALMKWKNSPIQKKNSLVICLIYALAILPSALWYGWVISSWGTSTVVGGLITNPTSFSNLLYILGYHVVVIWSKQIMGYPALLFFVVGLYFVFNKKYGKNEIWWAMFLTLVGLGFYFIYESSLISIDHDYYSLPFYLPFYVMIGFGLKKVIELLDFKLQQNKTFLSAGIILLAMVPINAYFTSNKLWSTKYSSFDITVLEKRGYLRAMIPDTAKCIMINDESGYIFSYLIDKQGYTFAHDHLPVEWVEDMVSNYGTSYLWSLSRKVDDRTDLQPYFEKIIFEEGQLKVFKLQMPKAKSEPH